MDICCRWGCYRFTPLSCTTLSIASNSVYLNSLPIVTPLILLSLPLSPDLSPVSVILASDDGFCKINQKFRQKIFFLQTKRVTSIQPDRSRNAFAGPMLFFFNRETDKEKDQNTDIFGFENAQLKSQAEEPNREFYLVQVDGIRHGGFTLNTEWGYQSDFVILTWGLRYGIPRAPQG